MNFSEIFTAAKRLVSPRRCEHVDGMFEHVRRIAELEKALEAAALLADGLHAALEGAQLAESQWRAKVRLLEQQIREKDAELLSRQELIEMYTLAAQERQEKLVEMSGALEEANAEVALLRHQIRDLETDKQLDLMEPPADSAEEPQPAVDDELINEVVQETVCRLVAPWFEGGKHFWAFALGTIRFTARVLDKQFLEQMNARKVFFAAGDAVRMKLRAVTYRKPSGGLYAKFSVEEVLGIIPPDQQMQFEPPALPIGAPAVGVAP
jgi:hypothetical protein